MLEKNKRMFIIVGVELTIVLLMLCLQLGLLIIKQGSIREIVFAIIALVGAFFFAGRKCKLLMEFHHDLKNIISMPSLGYACFFLALAILVLGIGISEFIGFTLIKDMPVYSLLVVVYISLAFEQSTAPFIAIKDQALYFRGRWILLSDIEKIDTSKTRKHYTTVYVFKKQRTIKQLAVNVSDETCELLKQRLPMFHF